MNDPRAPGPAEAGGGVRIRYPTTVVVHQKPPPGSRLQKLQAVWMIALCVILFPPVSVGISLSLAVGTYVLTKFILTAIFR